MKDGLVFFQFISVNQSIVIFKLVITTKQWTTIERNFENILGLKSNQENFWTEKIIPLVTHDNLV